MDSPFLITWQVSNSFKVKLPDSIKIYNIFSLDRLYKEPRDPLPRQLNDPLGLEIVHSKEEYEIQEVLASRTIRNQLEYCIK